MNYITQRFQSHTLTSTTSTIIMPCISHFHARPRPIVIFVACVQVFRINAPYRRRRHVVFTRPDTLYSIACDVNACRCNNKHERLERLRSVSILFVLSCLQRRLHATPIKYIHVRIHCIIYSYVCTKALKCFDTHLGFIEVHILGSF